MNFSKELKKINISETYQTEIFGLGEIYEIMSVENIRKKLLAKFSDGELYLASNYAHSKRGCALEELASYLEKQNITIIEQGFADSPPWNSKPLSGDSKKSYAKIIISLAKIIFFILVRIEFIWKGPAKSHMIYCLTQK